MNKQAKYYQHSQLGDGLTRLISYCPLCERSYESPLRAKILDERDGAHLVHLQCSSCGSSVVALVLTSSLGITSVGLITDLTGEDVLRFKDQLSVAVNDVIELHQLMYRK